MKLILILSEIYGNIIPTYTYEKIPNKYIDTNSVNVTVINNKENINFYKYYLKSSLTDLTKLLENDKIERIDIITYGEVFQKLTGKEAKKYIEPDKKNKINIFNIFQFMPFTTITIENFFLQLPKTFVKYRLNYLYDNVPVTDLTVNEKSLELINFTENIYKNYKLSLKDEFNYINNNIMYINYFNIKEILNKINLNYFPKLSSMNKIDLNIKLSSEKIYKKDIDYQKIFFLLSVYKGLFAVKNINFNISNSSNPKDIDFIILIDKMISHSIIY